MHTKFVPDLDQLSTLDATYVRQVRRRASRTLLRSFHLRYLSLQLDSYCWLNEYPISLLLICDLGLVLQCVQRSLNRLGVATVDLIQFHW